MNGSIASEYIRENFEPTDRLAIVLLNKRTRSVIQRLAEAKKIAAADFQAWLHAYNDQRYEIYISMNALHPQATGRRKDDVATIRHLYLDFDDSGTSAVETLLKRRDLPSPNYLVNSSPDKWQVVWKVQAFGKSEAEELQRALAHQTGADVAATDCSRVLRLPGFHNHKYASPHWISLERRAAEVYMPGAFPKIDPPQQPSASVSAGSRKPLYITQSERDWAYAKRALARGDSPDRVIAAIANYRYRDKHNPHYYAQLTVQKAGQALRAEHASSGPERS